jgi:hypothetical protein
LPGRDKGASQAIARTNVLVLAEKSTEEAMTHCLYLLLAAGAAAGPAQLPADGGYNQADPPAIVEAVPARPNRPLAGYGLADRLRRRLAPRTAQPRNSCECGCATNAVATTAAPLYHAQATPTLMVGDADELAEPAPAPAPRPDLKIAKKYENKVGHEEDYSWVTGHLFYVHADGGRWVVRYTLPDQVDKYGGSVVLAPAVEMRNFREGDLVCVFGRVLSDGRATPSLGGALYRVDSITMVERADP